MNKQLAKTAFVGGRAVLSLAHFAFQSAADLCVEAEVGLTKRTGYFAPDGKWYELDDQGLDSVRDARRAFTRTLQQRSIERGRKASIMLKGIK